MSNKPAKTPPYRIVAATLRKTTEHLARELAQPSISPPDWTDFEWAVAQSAAAMQGISVLLANNLQWSGPPLWQSFLEKQLAQSLLRDARIGTVQAQIGLATCTAQIRCVALKGAALRALNLYAPGERPMGDIDLLVRSDDLASMEAALGTLDYVLAYTSHRHAVYEPSRKLPIRGYGEHVENPLKIEVHTVVAEQLPVRKVDITECLVPNQARPGLNAYPSLAALTLHLLIHAAGNMRAHALRQIQLHDIAVLGGHLDDADWRTLLIDPNTNASRWWVFPALALTERYYAGSIPPEVLRQARRACPGPLRFTIDRQALTDVSWSNLRIQAFPGIAWSRTPRDAVRFMHSRVLPSRTALDELKRTSQAQPHLNQVRWYGISHRNRIVRWLLSRPPRVQTMISVTAALENAGLSPD